MNVENLNLLKDLAPRALEKWGQYAMLQKVCEELAELQVQVCKVVAHSPTTEDAVIDEIADVKIMVERLTWFYGEDRVNRRIDYKLHRLAKALVK